MSLASARGDGDHHPGQLHRNALRTTVTRAASVVVAWSCGIRLWRRDDHPGKHDRGLEKPVRGRQGMASQLVAVCGTPWSQSALRGFAVGHAHPGAVDLHHGKRLLRHAPRVLHPGAADGSPWAVGQFAVSEPGRGRNVFRCPIRPRSAGDRVHGCSRTEQPGSQPEKPNRLTCLVTALPTTKPSSPPAVRPTANPHPSCQSLAGGGLTDAVLSRQLSKAGARVRMLPDQAFPADRCQAGIGVCRHGL